MFNTGQDPHTYLCDQVDRRSLVNDLIQFTVRPNIGCIGVVGSPGSGRRTLLAQVRESIESPNCPSLVKRRVIELNIAQLLVSTEEGHPAAKVAEILNELPLPRSAGHNPTPLVLIDDCSFLLESSITPVVAALLDRILQGTCVVMGPIEPMRKTDLLHHRLLSPAGVALFNMPGWEDGDLLHILRGRMAMWQIQSNIVFLDGVAEFALAKSHAVGHLAQPGRSIALLDHAVAEVLTNNPKWQKPVDIEVVAQAAQELAQAPIAPAFGGNPESAVRLEESLRAEIFGQDAVVTAVARAITRSLLGFGNPPRPVASFLLAGPSGTGKTELARAVSRILYNGEQSLIRIDMSEFKHPVDVTRLFGSAPGFKGHENGGVLTNAITSRPRSIILFDEIEKAHPEVLDPLLQLLDAGRLTDGLGNSVDASQTIIFLTSNLGAADALASADRGGVGFSLDDGQSATLAFDPTCVEDAINAHLRPELRNRLDGVLIFRPLEIAALFNIAQSVIKRHLSKAVLNNSGVIIDVSVAKFLAQKAAAHPAGARAINALFDTNVLDPLVRLAIQQGGPIPRECVVRADQGAVQVSIGQVAVSPSVEDNHSWLKEGGLNLPTLPSSLKYLIDQLAILSHQEWAVRRSSEGWTYGPYRDDGKLVTPLLLPFDQLPQSEKDLLRETAEKTLRYILASGYSLEPCTQLRELLDKHYAKEASSDE